ncbi:MAG: branched-chain amino acid ABC transporter permease [Thermoplasmatota archaeon]
MKRERREWLLALALCIAIYLFLTILTYQPELATGSILHGIAWRYLESVLAFTLIFALFSLGLSLEFGYTGLINFGHVAFLAIGAYAAAVVAWHLGPSLAAAPWPVALFWSAVIVLGSAFVATGIAILLGFPTLRLREDYLAILTIGAAEILRSILTNEAWLTNGEAGIFATMPAANWVFDTQHGFGAIVAPLSDALSGPNSRFGIEPYDFFLILITVAALILGFLFVERLSRSPWGRVVRAIREDEDLASAVGKNVFAYKLSSLITGSIIAAFAGVLFAWYQRFINPDPFVPILTFYAWIAIVIGGVGNHKGALAGSFILYGIIESARDAPQNVPLLHEFAAPGPQQVFLIGLLLILVMLLRPQGVFGRRAELHLGK